MAVAQCILASRCGEDDLLKFKPSIRMGKKGDLGDFEPGMVVGARRAGLSISQTADLKIGKRCLVWWVLISAATFRWKGQNLA